MEIDMLTEKNKTKMMSKTYTTEEVEKIATQSYMRGMMVQEEVGKRKKPRQVFNVWLKELIKTIKPKQR